MGLQVGWCFVGVGGPFTLVPPSDLGCCRQTLFVCTGEVSVNQT